MQKRPLLSNVSNCRGNWPITVGNINILKDMIESDENHGWILQTTWSWTLLIERPVNSVISVIHRVRHRLNWSAHVLVITLIYDALPISVHMDNLVPECSHTRTNTVPTWPMMTYQLIAGTQLHTQSHWVGWLYDDCIKVAAWKIVWCCDVNSHCNDSLIYICSTSDCPQSN